MPFVRFSSRRRYRRTLIEILSFSSVFFALSLPFLSFLPFPSLLAVGVDVGAD